MTHLAAILFVIGLILGYLALGLEQVDEFVHVSGTGPGAWERQVHSRRAHSFLCVFQKGKPRPSVNGKRRTHAGHHETCWFPHAECACDLPVQERASDAEA